MTKIFATSINSFHYLLSDIELLLSVGERQLGKDFTPTKVARTSVILSIVALEALVNRSWLEFANSRDIATFVDNERRWDVPEKITRLVASVSPNRQIGKLDPLWQKLLEVIDIRNDYVHPKAIRRAYMTHENDGSFAGLKSNKIPSDLIDPRTSQRVKKQDLYYQHTGVTRDPYSVTLIDARTVLKVILDFIEELDRLFEGKIKRNNWWRSDCFELIYPEGETLV